MQSKAIEGVPRRAHALLVALRVFDISFSIFLRLCWSSHPSSFFFSLSAVVRLMLI